MRTLYYSLSLMVLIMGLSLSSSSVFADCGHFAIVYDKSGAPIKCDAQNPCNIGMGVYCNVTPTGKICPNDGNVCLYDMSYDTKPDLKQNSIKKSPKRSTK